MTNEDRLAVLEAAVEKLTARVEELENELGYMKHDIEHPFGCDCTSCD